MRIIDGMHRVRAARLRGSRVIEVEFFEGSEEAAFVRSVEANVTHGMPLSLEERKAAAMRIIGSMSHMSDKAIARCTGLADKTVATIRRHSTANSGQSEVRVGRDGRRRPVNGAEGRRMAAEAIAANPTAPLREVAKTAGVSLGTAHNVRARLRKDTNPSGGDAESAAPQESAEGGPRPALIEEAAHGSDMERNYEARLQSLQKDPSLRFSDMGKELLRWLNIQHAVDGRRSRVTEAVPPHLARIIAEMALHCAKTWREFAVELRARDE
jgi:hypothetical protein